MGQTSGIEWTDATANFWRGCDKVSPGCAHCYMFDGQRRFGRDPSVVVRCSPATFNAPLSKKWRAAAAHIAAVEGRRMRVFTCSWSDFFHEDADGWRSEAWDVIRACPEYDWQILTKRPELVAERLPADWGAGWPHVWLGVSIENRRFVHRADELRAIPAAVRFISAEPLLGPLVYPAYTVDAGRLVAAWPDGHEGPDLDTRGIDWLIVGGESGPDHRSMHPEWVRALRDQVVMLRRAGACSPAFFLKQWGGARPGGEALLDGREWHEFPGSPGATVSQVLPEFLPGSAVVGIPVTPEEDAAWAELGA